MYTYIRFALLLIVAGIFCQCQDDKPKAKVEEKISGAAHALEQWALYRSWPDGRLRADLLHQAFEARKNTLTLRDGVPEWESLGPKNIGGRTISLAFHPTDPMILYAGSASGGLWKSTTAGAGVEAWERVPTGYPVLGVGAIAIDPNNADVMYIGTGEVYNYNFAQPGIYNRLTRGSYGMGILKTSDGGLTWSKSLDWSYTDLTGVWDIVINPQRTQTLFAATTEGLFRSYDAGESWNLIHDIEMSVDIEMHPLDTNVLFVSYGNLDSPQRGIYRSDNGGNSFTLVNGLPSNYTGKSLISISPSNPEVMYVSVADIFASIGLYKSEDGGENWININNSDVAKYQGWYSHDVAIKPDNPDQLIYVGIDAFKSTDGGVSLQQKTYWYAWDFGQVPVGGPEGPTDYVHADIHGVYYSPFDANTVYAVTDGGIFVSSDNGESWSGRNGGYQTQQFYANFSNSRTNPNLGIGGMQDNATAIYVGDDAWIRVIGGDGMSTAINPLDDQIMYGAYQNLNLQKSEDGGESFFGIGVNSASGESKNFNGPFELDPQNPAIIYAGAQRLHISQNGGNTWQATSTGFVDPATGNPILSIAVSPEDSDLIYVSTAPLLGGIPRLYRSLNGGSTWQAMSGLPNRVAMDIAFHPENQDEVFVVFSGFGSSHVYKTVNGGNSWLSLSNGLPDIPVNCIFVDPMMPDDIYIGTDLGVYASFDGGFSWEAYSDGIAEAAMVMHLSISEPERKLRAATHGLGVYQTDLREPVGVKTIDASILAQLRNYPNPVLSSTTFEFELVESARVKLELRDNQGRLLRSLFEGQAAKGLQQKTVYLEHLPAGSYIYTLMLDGQQLGSRQLIKR
ncbi:MAG TPA: T9SS type A sorting domain-containing protein [Saprospiraceae bacterium]|mgnify:CR=1 FL=1|nr:T9SS type A sorting domain-containing protein [Saprospiraceae bacterium]HMQ84259.1 T9SS type A sorting domain-containing protein [Saprospiraceae bacterium]